MSTDLSELLPAKQKRTRQPQQLVDVAATDNTQISDKQTSTQTDKLTGNLYVKLTTFPDYVLPHLSLAQSHEPKVWTISKFRSQKLPIIHFCKYNSGFLFLLSTVLLLLLSLSLVALVSYSVVLICYSAIRLLSHKCAIKLSVRVSVSTQFPK